LTGKRALKAVRNALKNLATGSGAYDYAYEDAMERINGQIKDQEELAKQVLLWITCAKRPLTTTELQHALGVEVGESELDEENFPQIEDIVSICAGLVTVDEESSIIRLVHYTTQEYFDRTRDIWFPNAETNITTICVTYLLFNEFESGTCQNDKEFEERLWSSRLYDYVSHNWGHHARKASTLIPEVISFLKKQAQVEASSQALLAVKRHPSDLEYSQRFPRKMTGLHLAAHFGIEAAVKLLLAKGADVAAASSDGWTPLYGASLNGHIDVVKLLLDKGADVAAADSNRWTPLYRASSNGHIDIVKLLLDKGADVAAASSDGWTPLHTASFNGHIDVVKLLLDKGADVDLKDDRYGRTPLSRAVENGKEAIVKLLLATNSVEPDSKDIIGRTPLFYGAKNGNRATIELLLATSQVDVDSKDYYSSISLSIAARMGHRDIVALLLTRSLSFNVKDNLGRSPLWWARRSAHPEIADLLLEKYRENSMTDQDDFPIATISVLSNEDSGYCDVCMLAISDKDTCYYCKVCSNGDFWICKECFAMKAHCLYKSHTLVRK
jgi:ankyrin repeat protein